MQTSVRKTGKTMMLTMSHSLRERTTHMTIPKAISSLLKIFLYWIMTRLLRHLTNSFKRRACLSSRPKSRTKWCLNQATPCCLPRTRKYGSPNSTATKTSKTTETWEHKKCLWNLKLTTSLPNCSKGNTKKRLSSRTRPTLYWEVACPKVKTENS